MNKTVSKIFLSDLFLRELVFTYNECGLFIKHFERIQKFRETCNLKHIYQNKLDKACFTDDRAFKDLAKRIISDKVLKNRAYELGNNPKVDGYQRQLESMVYNRSSLMKNRICNYKQKEKQI